MLDGISSPRAILRSGGRRLRRGLSLLASAGLMLAEVPTLTGDPELDAKIIELYYQHGRGFE